jgi:transcriptional regulator GlxA family with amidase domain
MAETTIVSHILPMARPKTIAFFALAGVQTLDVTGPMEVFALANRIRPGSYDLMLASSTGQRIPTHAGLDLGPARPLALLPEGLDTLVICGGSEAAMRDAWETGTELPWLRDRAPDLRRIVSICTGAFVLAASGLLDGRRATTHWAACDEFRRLFPSVTLEPDAIFVCDPPYFTSAGVTAGIDLSLSLVEADHGAEVALAIARELVLFLRRPGGQSQFSAGAKLQAQGVSRLQMLVTSILDDPGGQVSGQGRTVPDLAQAAGMSERSFARVFVAETGLTPARFVEEARLTRAKALLEAGEDPLDRIAERAGYGATDGLHRAFQKALNISPGAYRARFSTATR